MTATRQRRTAAGLTVGSVFTGIGGIDKGLEDAGWEVQWQVENDEFCNRILKRHWPTVARYGDIRAVDAGEFERVGLICGGSPCQDVSVAGQRKGLAGERSALFFDFIRIISVVRPRWVLFENVPGLFSSQSGRDFLTVISSLDELGYGLAWRCLDSQHFGVPQRRRRIYLVGHLGAPCPPEVLFEPESVRGDTAAGRGKGADIAYALAASVRGSGDQHGQGWNTTYPLTSRGPGERQEREGTYVIQDAREVRDKAQHGSGIQQGGPSYYTLDGVSQHAVAYGPTNRPDGRDWHELTRSRALNAFGGPGASPALIGAPTDPDGVRETSGVPRRLDSARYRALGNAVTATVAKWIGERMRRAMSC